MLRRLAWIVLVGQALLGTALGHGVATTTAGLVEGPVCQSGLECLGQLQPRRSDEIAGSRWGVCGHWLADKHELSVEEQLDNLAWLGAKWVFLCPDWDCIETEKGKYDWNSPVHRFDDVVRGLSHRKIAPVIQIYGGNRLYMPFAPDPNNRPLADVAALLGDRAVRDAWHRYLEALVRRYHGSVKVWEIWNEPNYPAFWKTETTATDYGRIVQDVAAIIRRVDPEAIVLAGSMAGESFVAAVICSRSFFSNGMPSASRRKSVASPRPT
jgi:hypothetical protein